MSFGDLSMLQIILGTFCVTFTLLLAAVLRQIRALHAGNERAQARSEREQDIRQERIERSLREELAINRREMISASRDGRSEFAEAMNQFTTNTRAQFSDFREQLLRLLESSEHKADALRQSIEQKLMFLQQDNNKKLEEMRATVAEKLEGTLERRLGDSFKLVSDRLEQVHKGLGEMQNLAVGVGDLKRVMTNVKTRGTWGEIQLGNILEQLLAPEQFERNVATKKGANGRVEYAIKMPGQQPGQSVWLPIDAKFPVESYERLIEAQDKGLAEGMEMATRQLENQIKLSARDISEKYLSPPETTDFALMYLPTEGLFAEVVRRIGLVEQIQREHRIVVAGPTTLAALLNSLQMGFKTLAIQQRSSEVWEILGAVKTEFSRFGDILNKVEKKLQEAGNVIHQAGTRTRVIERKLKNVQELPQVDAVRLMGAAAQMLADDFDAGDDLLPDEVNADLR